MHSLWPAVSRTPVNFLVFMFLAASKDFALIPTLTLKFFQCTPFKQIQIINQNTVFFIEQHVYKHSDV